MQRPYGGAILILRVEGEEGYIATAAIVTYVEVEIRVVVQIILI